jgi:hypothetical protein
MESRSTTRVPKFATARRPFSAVASISVEGPGFLLARHRWSSDALPNRQAHAERRPQLRATVDDDCSAKRLDLFC